MPTDRARVTPKRLETIFAIGHREHTYVIMLSGLNMKPEYIFFVIDSAAYLKQTIIMEGIHSKWYLLNIGLWYM
jgi:hypothetical protein